MNVLRLLVAALLLLATQPALGKRPAPRVAVAIVVDQLAAWVAEERLPLLPKSGGFARLLPRGVEVPHFEFMHALTETAPAHAALYTGKLPRETGIVANDVLRPGFPAKTSLLVDPETRLVGAAGVLPDRPGISLALLRASTLSEALLAKDPQATVISISIKDRGAAFAGARTGGNARRPQVVWWDPESRQVVTSTAFASALPPWVRQPGLPAEVRWTPADASWLARVARLPDDQPGESEDLGGRSFPHAFAPDGRKFRATAQADQLVVDLALAAARAQGPLSHPMLLALSFSRYDYVGHRFGPESWEAWDALRTLDSELARLFSGLDALLGKDAYTVVLSADHGMAPLHETLAGRTPDWCRGADPYERPCKAGTHLRAGDLAARLRAAVGPDRVDAVLDTHVYLKEAVSKEERTIIERTLRAEPGIAAILPGCGFAAGPEASALERLVADSVTSCTGDDPRLPAYFLVPEPGAYFADPPDVAGHGSPYPYDRAVPFLVRHARGRGAPVEKAPTFRSFRDTLWFALTGETPR